MNEQAVFYALSTLAQACAALAALIGALGIYLLESLKERQKTSGWLLRSLIPPDRMTRDEVFNTDMLEVIRVAREVILAGPPDSANIARMKGPLADVERMKPDERRIGRLLLMFETWVLLVILLSLIGFLRIPWLVCSTLANVTFGLLSAGTVLATALMLWEARGSLARRLRAMGLGCLVDCLEKGD